MSEEKVIGRNDIVMNRPASTFGCRFRDGTPIGSGATGALLYGAIENEHLIIHRGDVWCNGKDAPVPDVTDALAAMRAMQADGNYEEAADCMEKALKEKGYATDLADMRTLGEVTVCFDCSGAGFFRQYTRTLHLDRAEAEVTFSLGKNACRRRYVASRARDVIGMEITSAVPQTFSVHAGFFRSHEGGRELDILRSDAETTVFLEKHGCSVYAFQNAQDGKFCGIVTRVISSGTQRFVTGGVSVAGAKSALVLIKAFSGYDDRERGIDDSIVALLDCPVSYDALFEESLPLYKALYEGADISLYSGNGHTNEELLSAAMQTDISPELVEKLWRYARYLFISGTRIGDLPFPLYGLWCCGYQRTYTHHVANENVQSIYWHADVGGLSSLIEPLIDYYVSHMESFRENARRLYGCRGIFVGTYTTPKNAAVAWWLPVILHFCGVAGWLSSHFYRYYQFSGNETLFEEKILPFMIEAAEFYEDYHYLDEQGKLVLYPAVSPENTPREHLHIKKPHPMPVTKNPTIEIAILKELLTNLCEIAETRENLREKAAVWSDMLKKIPSCRINSDGAIAEWIAAEHTDTYAHRHVSHLYPVFPGTELEDSESDALRPAFKRALELRNLGALCGWSFPHMSAIYSRMGDSDKAYEMMSGLAKVCLLENFFTLCCDYREMGVNGMNIDPDTEAGSPIQFDALISHANALQEMLLLVTKKKVRLLPACPDKLGIGSATLRFATGKVTMSWNLPQKECHGEIIAERDTDTRLLLPFGKDAIHLKLKKGERFVF